MVNPAEPADVVGFGVLGDVEAHRGDQLLDVGHARQQCVLAALLVEPNRTVATDELVERVWSHRPPHRARNAVSGYVSRLRQVLGDTDGARIIRRSGGYVLTTDPLRVDLHVFRDLVARARRATAIEDTTELLTAAAGLWRGTAFGSLDTPWLNEVRSALDAERLAAELDRRDLVLRSGRHAELLGELVADAAAHPLDERVAGQLILALSRSGRQADALRAYEEVRHRLAAELGVDPGADLRDLHQQMLQGRTAIAPAEPGPATDAGHRPGRRAGWTLVPRQLPAPPRSFVGRTSEIAELDAVLDATDARATAVVISALSGTAGVGKTALALHWAHGVAERFADGQLYVNLRGFEPNGPAMAPAEAVRTFLDAFQVPPERIPATLDAQSGLYRSLLAGRRVLVVLDNARDAEQVRPLLPGGPGCVAVVTSRNRLTGLIASEGALPLPLDLLTAAESRAVLIQRLGPDRVGAEPAAVDEIVERCVGLPLALTIVAARAAAHRTLSLAALAQQLHNARDRLNAFAIDDPTADVRAVFSASYHALDPAAARLFRLLGLHPGPDLTAAAAGALAGLPVPAVTTLLDVLVGGHLVSENVPGRYAFHDLLRAYAAELARSAESGDERHAALHRMFDHYLHTAADADELLYPHRDPVEPLPVLPGSEPAALLDQAEAITWFTAESAVLLGLGPLAIATGFELYSWRLVGNLVNFLDRRKQWPALRAAHDDALRAAERLGDLPGQAVAHRGLARHAIQVGSIEDCLAHGDRALTIYGELGDAAGQAQTHLVLSTGLDGQDRRPEAAAHAERALELYRTAGHRAGEANSLNNLGWILAQTGELDQALAYCTEALGIQQELGDRYFEGMTSDSLGYVEHLRGHDATAITWYQRALVLFVEQGACYMEADSLIRMGEAHEARGELDDAHSAWRAAIRIYDDMDDPEADALRARVGKP